MCVMAEEGGCRGGAEAVCLGQRRPQPITARLSGVTWLPA